MSFANESCQSWQNLLAPLRPIIKTLQSRKVIKQQDAIGSGPFITIVHYWPVSLSLSYRANSMESDDTVRCLCGRWRRNELDEWLFRYANDGSSSLFSWKRLNRGVAMGSLLEREWSNLEYESRHWIYRRIRNEMVAAKTADNDKLTFLSSSQRNKRTYDTYSGQCFCNAKLSPMLNCARSVPIGSNRIVSDRIGSGEMRWDLIDHRARKMNARWQVSSGTINHLLSSLSLWAACVSPSKRCCEQSETGEC